MGRRRRTGVHPGLCTGVAALVGLSLTGCSRPATDAGSHAEPATVEQVHGSSIGRVTVTESAARRLGIQTAAVRAGTPGAGGVARTVVPVAAVLYDPQGGTWTYTQAGTRTFVRHAITVDEMTVGEALLLDGPPVGTPVVTVGVAELLGVEYDVGH
ncbi:MAG: hypothetical protein ACRDJO_02640 [Actinomycetota bacterium]